MSSVRHLSTVPGFRRAAAAALGFLVVGAFVLVTVGATSEEAGAAWTSTDLVWESEHCGVTESVVVPPFVTEVYVVAFGGGGGTGGTQFGASGGEGGSGSREEKMFPVVPGQVISMVVGCRGADGSASPNDTATPGWATGGGAGIGSTSAFEGGASGGAGGGATGVCIGSSVCTPAEAGTTLRLVTGGGGGGGVRNCVTVDAANSDGGNGSGAPHPVAVNGGSGQSGVDGSSSNGAGGAGGVNDVLHSVHGDASANGSGGAGVNVVGGGGGGGYRGGGAGQGANTGCVGGGGGGGGSSWIHGGADYLSSGCPPYPTTPPCESREGSVDLWFRYPATMMLTSSINPSAPGQSVNFHAEVTDALGPHAHSIDYYIDGALVADGTDGNLTHTFGTAGDYEVEAVFDWTQQAGGRGTTRAMLTQHVGYYVTSLPGGTTLPPFTLPGTTLTPTTASPTTLAPTTVTPTTATPTSVAPTTVTPTTVTPTTVTPTTVPPTTVVPTTTPPTTTPPPTAAPTSLTATTVPPTSVPPSTFAPTTAPPATATSVVPTSIVSESTTTTTGTWAGSTTTVAGGTDPSPTITVDPGGTGTSGDHTSLDPSSGVSGNAAVDTGGDGALARTGSNVIGLAGIGLLLTALGAGAVVFAGHRRDFRP